MAYLSRIKWHTNFARRTNSRIQESRENSYPNSSTKEKSLIINYGKNPKIQKFANNFNTRNLPDLPYIRLSRFQNMF